MKNNILRASGYLLAFAVIMCFVFSCTGTAAFEAYASAPSISLQKENVGLGEEIVVRYRGTGWKDWIGIYPEGTLPGPGNPSLRWCYAQNGAGSVSLIAQSEVDANVSLPAGKYQVYLLQNDGYTILDRKNITVSYRAEDYLPEISFGAGRTINLTPSKRDASVSYELYLGTASGKLPGYTSLGTAELRNNRYSHTVGACAVIPSAATHLYAYVKTGAAETKYFTSVKIPASFYNNASFGSKLYEFQIFTDIHITDDQNGTYGRHFKMALQDVLRNSPNSKAIVTIGDNTDNGREIQWQNFTAIKNSVLKNGRPNMYFTMGNHDRDYNGSYASQVALFKKYTGMSGVYYSFTIENSTFIVLGSESKGGFANLTDTQLNWLESQLKKAAPGKPIFIFLHEPLKDTVSGSLTSLHQQWYGVQQDARLRKIIDPYANAMLFTGHTHWHFNTTQPMLYGGGRTANYFNASAVSYLWNDEDREVAGSQGYYVEVYQNGIFVRGRDFANGLWTPATQYFVPVSGGSSTPPPATPTQKPVTGKPATPTPTQKPTQAQGSPSLTAAAGSPTATTAAPSATQTAAPSAAPGFTGTPAPSAGTATPSAAPLPGADGGKKTSPVLVISAAVLSAAAIAAAAAAGRILYKSRKG